MVIYSFLSSFSSAANSFDATHHFFSQAYTRVEGNAINDPFSSIYHLPPKTPHENS
jgi:hypothetical protein